MKTVFKAIWKYGIGRTLRKVTELSVGILLGACVVAPSIVADDFLRVAEIESYAPVKFIFVLAAFYYRKTIFRLCKRWVRIVQKFFKPKEKQIDNIPVAELVDYLIRNRHFRREGINGARATFGLNMDKFNKLARHLEDRGVLTRADNNGRVLAEQWSRQSLVDYLSGKDKSSELLPRFKIRRIGENAKIRLDNSEMMI